MNPIELTPLIRDNENGTPDDKWRASCYCGWFELHDTNDRATDAGFAHLATEHPEQLKSERSRS